MLLWSVKHVEQTVGRWEWLQRCEDLPDDVALEAADDLGLAQAVLGALDDVGVGAWVITESTQGNGVQGVVGGPVAAAVEPVTVGSAAAGRDGGDPAQVREGGF